MTLNITVLTEHCIYQSADYRLVDLQTNAITDFQTQKNFVVNTYKWTATVCFTGVGRTQTIDVHDWVSDKLGLVQMNDPFERLIEKLLEAKNWLSNVPPPKNKHSFSIGAFIGTKPLFALISNFERPSGQKLKQATKELSVFEVPINKTKVFVPGQSDAITRLEKKQLRSVSAGNPEPERMHLFLANVNRRAAARRNNISPACCTTHFLLTGEGETRVHNVGKITLPNPVAMPKELRETITQVADAQFGLNNWRIAGTSFSRWDNSDDYHNAQVREKPNDPNVHSNFGVFLKEKKNDPIGAEREYRTALNLDPKHVNALGNLANLVLERGDKEQAIGLYRKALEIEPGNENVTLNFAKHLMKESDKRISPRTLLDEGISANPQSGRLHLLQAELHLRDGSISEALERFREARERGANQNQVEIGYAYALQLSNAPIGKCIDAYHVAISLNPDNAVLRLNLAQLLFLKDDRKGGEKNLVKAQQIGLDKPAQLEALFYRLCHTPSDSAPIFDEMEALLQAGARSSWNFQPNIEAVRAHEPQKSSLLGQVSKVIKGELDTSHLDHIKMNWPS